MKPLRHILAWILFAVALACATVVGGIAVKGGRWTFLGMSAADPMSRMFLGAMAIAGWGVLRKGLPRGTTVGKVCLLAVSLGVSVVAAEWGVREYLRRTQGFDSLESLKDFELGLYELPRSTTPMVAVIRLSENRRLLYENRKGLDMMFGNYPMRTNQSGMREDVDYPIERRPESVRIMGIGDSAMFGWGVDQNEDYLGVMETLLNAREDGIAYEVLNTGVPGYNTRQELELLKAQGLAYRPDVVVLGWCLNDWSPPTFLYEQQEFDERDYSYLWGFLFRRKQFFERIAPQVIDRKKVDTERVDPTLLDDAGEEGVRRALTELRDLADTEGFKLLVFGPLKPDILNVLDALEIDRVNTYEAIPGGTFPKEFYVHALHPRAAGHALLGEALAAGLVARGWLEPGGSVGVRRRVGR